jgi:aryl-alcohol dehydrogenase-like predicted oxidoreductase
VQVVYNIFDKAPEDELFPLCRELDVAVIARVPFDEGTLTGTLTLDTRWPLAGRTDGRAPAAPLGPPAGPKPGLTETDHQIDHQIPR